jgi:hypothetical protein
VVGGKKGGKEKRIDDREGPNSNQQTCTAWVAIFSSTRPDKRITRSLSKYLYIRSGADLTTSLSWHPKPHSLPMRELTVLRMWKYRSLSHTLSRRWSVGSRVSMCAEVRRSWRDGLTSFFGATFTVIELGLVGRGVMVTGAGVGVSPWEFEAFFVAVAVASHRPTIILRSTPKASWREGERVCGCGGGCVTSGRVNG